MANIPIDWLLQGEPWIAYRTRLDLLGQSATNPDVLACRQAMLADPQVQGLIQDLGVFPWSVIASHKSAGQPFHRLNFLADLGITASDPGMPQIVSGILAHQSPEGPFQLPVNISTSYGGSGQDHWGWALCDAPLLVYALLKMGLAELPEVKLALQYLVGLVRDNGWPCAVSKELGNFRGPGRKDDPCPFATLAMLKALSTSEELRDSPACHTGTETMLSLWAESQTRHPYIFYMGTDFRKLKVPFVWYDLLHVLDVLSRFSWLQKDARLVEMLGILKSKADPQGLFCLESVWSAWKDWEFGQKKQPSRWLTLLSWRIIQRFET